MKKALISPNEIVDGRQRIAHVSPIVFSVASPLFWVDCEDHITDSHTYSNGVFFNRIENAAIPKSCTALQFMDRFTEVEQLSIVTATMSVPQVKLWYDRMIAATEIVYKDPRTFGGLQALVSAELISANRLDEILPVAWR